MIDMISHSVVARAQNAQLGCVNLSPVLFATKVKNC
jgi:hypothetical protein